MSYADNLFTLFNSLFCSQTEMKHKLNGFGFFQQEMFFICHVRLNGCMRNWEMLDFRGHFFVCLFVSNGCADDTFVILLENGI